MHLSKSYGAAFAGLLAFAGLGVASPENAMTLMSTSISPVIDPVLEFPMSMSISPVIDPVLEFPK